ncbi:MAG: SDR family oxidoreductase [Pseudomonadota bacterium]
MGAVSEKSILITGCSSGIGYHCAHGLKERGWRVFATARKPQDLARLKYEGLETVYLDYADPKSIAHCAEHVLQHTQGQLFALFNNGAYGQPGAVEDLSTDVLRRQLETNVFGWHDLTRRLLPTMRRNGAGRIVQNSSVLGLVALKWRGAYNASKFAIEGLSDTLRLELEGTGIHVVLIEPGPIKSKFVNTSLEHFKKNVDVESSHHAELYKGQLARMEGASQTAGGRFKLGPEAVLKCLVKALEEPQPKARYYVTTPTFVLGALRRVLPHRLLDPILSHFSDN